MAHSIESRVPLLDNEVIDFAASLPSGMKIREGRRKHVLKRAVADLLPPSIVGRRKQGFGVPIGVWFRGGLTQLFRDVLLSPTATAADTSPVVHPADRRRAPVRHARPLLPAVATRRLPELWHRRYLDAPGSGYPITPGRCRTVHALIPLSALFFWHLPC